MSVGTGADDTPVSNVSIGCFKLMAAGRTPTGGPHLYGCSVDQYHHLVQITNSEVTILTLLECRPQVCNTLPSLLQLYNLIHSLPMPWDSVPYCSMTDLLIPHLDTTQTPISLKSSSQEITWLQNARMEFEAWCGALEQERHATTLSGHKLEQS